MQWPSRVGGYDNLRSRIEGCGSAEKFWSFDPKLPNLAPYCPPREFSRPLLQYAEGRQLSRKPILGTGLAALQVRVLTTKP